MRDIERVREIEKERESEKEGERERKRERDGWSERDRERRESYDMSIVRKIRSHGPWSHFVPNACMIRLLHVTMQTETIAGHDSMAKGDA